MPSHIEYKGTIARWLPRDPKVVRKFQQEIVARLTRKGKRSRSGEIIKDRLSDVIRNLEHLIETTGELYRDFHEMFDEVKAFLGPDEGRDDITDYKLLLAALDETITTAPQYSWVSPLVSGVPMYGILAPFCNTRAGYRAFTHPRVNEAFHEIFTRWREFLVSEDSCYVLTEEENGWFSSDALKVQEDRLLMRFQDAWICDPDAPHWGFKSWDKFFVREFRDGIRPTMLPDNSEYINVACEAITYGVFDEVQAMDEFWIKEMPYSLNHILNFDPLAEGLVGGTVFQAMLSSLDYHRWRSPVDGEVVKTYVVPGTYYAARVDRYEEDLPEEVREDPDVISRSQAFVTAISTRALIFIRSDNPAIGLMCFVGVGLGEVSTTKLEVQDGDRVKKGDELGSFRFGGSTHLLVFGPDTKLTFLADAEGPADADDPKARVVGTLLFHVDNTSTN